MKATWRAPDTNTDGSPFVKEQYLGFELRVDTDAAVSVPIAWDDDREYSFDFADLDANYAPGNHAVSMRVLAKGDTAVKASAWSEPATWTVKAKTPNPPFIVAVE